MEPTYAEPALDRVRIKAPVAAERSSTVCSQYRTAASRVPSGEKATSSHDCAQSTARHVRSPVAVSNAVRTARPSNTFRMVLEITTLRPSGDTARSTPYKRSVEFGDP